MKKKKLLPLFIFLLAPILALGYYFQQPRRVALRIAWVSNPRFRDISQNQLQEILALTQEICRERFKVELAFRRVKRLGVSEYFASYRYALQQDEKTNTHMLPISPESIQPLAESFLASTYRDISTEELHAAVRNQEGVENIDFSKGAENIFVQVARIHIAKMETIKKIICADGQPLIRDDFFNEYMAWTYICEHQNDYDLVITNQLLASAESYYPDIHSSMRGGISSGFTERSPTRLGAAVIVTVFPFLAEYDFFTQARGSDYDSKTANRCIAYLLAHEIGHMLLYRGHHYDHPGCIMRPTPGLKYKEWVAELERNGSCRKAHP